MVRPRPAQLRHQFQHSVERDVDQLSAPIEGFLCRDRGSREGPVNRCGNRDQTREPPRREHVGFLTSITRGDPVIGIGTGQFALGEAERRHHAADEPRSRIHTQGLELQRLLLVQQLLGDDRGAALHTVIAQRQGEVRQTATVVLGELSPLADGFGIRRQA
ncbi:Uncharacterised protein [Mycobacteroides abscessus subsp. abscessus]|nr:Uncharacterised protein [Mycobacteroides abscessus subsp. abscessus]